MQKIEIKMTELLWIFFAIIIVGSVSGCTNTFHGMGQDIEKAGENIQNATR